ncbi:MAG TPA: RluA family pseudouridine synthase [Acidobacteriaceae bacterium]|nr:RluA family pseudouridine synthase [Acidobacteriaceae bacterium]
MPTENSERQFQVDASTAGQRLDQFLAQQWEDVSRSRVQQMIARDAILVDGKIQKPSWKLREGETVRVLGDPTPEPLHAEAEAIPLDIVYEDAHLAVIHKPAGMMVHAGSGATEDARNRGTLVNALLHHFGQQGTLSTVGGAIRPGIVHRLDKQTSGLILVAKDDRTHRRLAEMFSNHKIEKTYIALVHGHVAKDTGTLDAAISRDRMRRTRMTTRRSGGRSAVSHYRVLERMTGPFGKFSLVEVRIETGRTHQIRVHLSSIGHPVVGDTLYGAPHDIVPPVVPAAGRSVSVGKTGRTAMRRPKAPASATLTLDRNFLHAARLRFLHPETEKPLELEAPLPLELTSVLQRLRNATTSGVTGNI